MHGDGADEHHAEGVGRDEAGGGDVGGHDCGSSRSGSLEYVGYSVVPRLGQ